MAEQSEKKLARRRCVKYEYKNQLHNPKYTAANENKIIKMFLKSGNSTMLLAKLNQMDATSLGMYIENYLKKRNSRLEGTFIFTR